MSEISQERLEGIERELGALARRLSHLEAELSERSAPVPGPLPTSGVASSPYERPERAPEPAPPEAALAPARPPRPRLDLEELIGGRLLAWIGGVAIVLGVAFFVAVAISRGWIDEPTRIVLATLASLALMGLGVWLRERLRVTQAALAAVGAAIAALYLTLIAATQLYGLIPTGLALALALANAGLAGALAVRWEARTIAGLGIVGALLAPPLVGADATAGTAAFLLVALLAAVSVLVWRRWDWLAVAAFLVSAPQLVDFALAVDSSPGRWVGLGAAAVYWALMVAAAVGYELRRPTAELRPSSAVVLVGGALAAAGAGWLALGGKGGPGDLWVAGLALANGATAAAVLRSQRASRAVGLLLLAIGVALGDLALGLLLDGAALALVWAASAVAFAAGGLVRTEAEAPDVLLARLGCGVQVTLATLRVLVFAEDFGAPVPADELGAVAGVSVAAAACARLAPAESREWRSSLDALAMGALALLMALALDGGALSAALAATAFALLLAAKVANERVALVGAGAYLALAIGHTLTLEAPPAALRDGVTSLPEAGLALGALAAALASGARLMARAGARPTARSEDRLRGGLAAGAAAAIVYLVSAAIVTAFQPGAESLGAGLDVRQQGQLLLSGFWGLTGLGLLIAGLLRDTRELRLGGFSLLVLALGKVFFYDLAALDSIYRVLSCVALGLLSLAAALAWQRMARRGPQAGAEAGTAS